jgi:hypothetical protein
MAATAPFLRAMRERLIFVSEVERTATREALSVKYPLGKLWYVPDDTDFIMDTEFPCTEETFFRYAVEAPGPAGLLIFSCLHLSLMMLDPPPWMLIELASLHRRLPANT